MANGRLASVKIPAGQAALVYSNTSGKEASITLAIAALSATATPAISAAVDTATLSFNSTTTISTPSASVSAPVMYVDYSGANKHNKFMLTDAANQQFTTWNGTAFASAGTYYGEQSYLKIDPYFITNPSAYNRTSPIHPVYDALSNVIYNVNMSTITGTQFSSMLNRSGLSAYGTVAPVSNHVYAAFGFDYDPYTQVGIGVYSPNTSYSYMIAFNFIDGTTAATQNTSFLDSRRNNNGWYYNYTTPKWYMPRILSSNGIFLVQWPNYTTPNEFYLIDATSASTSAQLTALTIAPGNSGSWWHFALPSGSTADQFSWLEYNPNNQRWYCRYSYSGQIFSFTKSDFASVSKGSVSSSSFGSYAKLEATTSGYHSRPLRVGPSLWRTIASSSNTGSNPYYLFSTDLVNWTYSPSSTYPTSAGYPAGVEHFYQVSDEIYYYTISGTDDIKKYDLGYTTGISDVGTLEYQVPANNYQRSGLVVSSGDKIYVKNGGSVPVAVSVMGYEG